MNLIAYNSKTKRLGRSQTGSYIVEGTVAILMITAGIIATTFLMINIGILIYYKCSLAFATQEAANFGADLITASGWSWNGVVNNTGAAGSTDLRDFDKFEKLTHNRVVELLKAARLPIPKNQNGIVVRYKRFDLVTPLRVTVRVKYDRSDKLPLLVGTDGMFSTGAQLQDKSVAIIKSDSPRALFYHWALPQVDGGPIPYNPAYGLKSSFKNIEPQEGVQLITVEVPSNGQPLDSFFSVNGIHQQEGSFKPNAAFRPIPY